MKKTRIIIFLSIFFIITATFSLAYVRKNITRTEDPLVVEGKNLKYLLGSKPGSLALMTYKSNTFKPIPFQIDQKHKNGEYAFDFGDNASKDADPNFDENDELAFMANDLGHRVPSRKLPDTAVTGMELEIVNPVDKSRGWVYLFKFSKKAPRSPIDYIRLEMDSDKNYKKVFTKDSKGYGYILGSPLRLSRNPIFFKIFCSLIIK